MRIGDNSYKLILLDTNALREIVMNSNFSGKGFLQRFFVENKGYAPCFSIYNVIELLPYKDIYNKFLDFFCIIPCLMTFTTKQILHEEYDCYLKGKRLQINNNIANAFSRLIDNDSYNLKKFLTKMENRLVATIKTEIDELPDIADTWKKQRKKAKELLNKMKLPKEIIDEQYYISQEQETILKDLNNWGLSPHEITDISRLPAARIMEYSQFNRIHLTSKQVAANDVMDIMISCIIPYVDAVITEGFQGNVYKKAKKIIPQLNNLEIYALRDIRL